VGRAQGGKITHAERATAPSQRLTKLVECDCLLNTFSPKTSFIGPKSKLAISSWVKSAVHTQDRTVFTQGKLMA